MTEFPLLVTTVSQFEGPPAVTGRSQTAALDAAHMALDQTFCCLLVMIFDPLSSFLLSFLEQMSSLYPQLHLSGG